MGFKVKRFGKHLKKEFERPIKATKSAVNHLSGNSKGGDDDEARSQAAGKLVRKTTTRQGGAGAFTYGEDVFE